MKYLLPLLWLGSFFITESRAVSISGGNDHTLYLCADSSVWASGSNAHKELGICCISETWKPLPVLGLPGKFVAVSAGLFFSMALDENGKVWTWGSNQSGQLGNCSTILNDTCRPQQVISNIQMIATGDHHAMALDSSGQVYVWGNNQYGQVGNGTWGNISNKPYLVDTLPPVKAIAGGRFHSLAVTATGDVWTWGFNRYGQLGNGIFGLGQKETRPQLIAGLNNIVQVSGGHNHSLALDNAGQVWIFGGNINGMYGECNRDSTAIPFAILTNQTISDIAAGHWFNLFLDAGGTAWAAGHAIWGQTGKGYCFPDFIKNDSISKLHPDDTCVVQVNLLNNISNVEAGRFHSLVVQNDSIFVFGLNNFGQLGLDDQSNRCVPTALALPCSIAVDAGNNKTICSGDAVILGGTPTVDDSAGVFEYVWFPATGLDNIASPNPTATPLNTTAYVVSVLLCGNVVGKDTVIVAVDTLPKLTITPGDTSICPGDSITLSANLYSSYQWSTGDSTPKITVYTEGNYQVSVPDTEACNPTLSVKVSLYPQPFATLLYANACAGQLTSFTGIHSIEDIQSWTWDFGDGQTASTATPFHTFSDPGLYDISLTVTDRNGCRDDTVLQDLEVFIPPRAAFMLSPPDTIVSIGQIVSFQNQSEEAISYKWSFGDGSQSQLEHPDHAYSYPGQYTVQLIAAGAVCQDTVSAALRVESVERVFLPNIFTPNGDGQNDLFLAKGVGISDFDMQIFNRWGTALFRSNDINQGWDGTYKGKVQEIDTYVYIIHATSVTGNKIFQKGDFVLMQ